jgi:hypothetical protein
MSELGADQRILTSLILYEGIELSSRKETAASKVSRVVL